MSGGNTAGLSMATLQLIQMAAAVVLGVPCFFSDGFSCYLSALMEVYHTLQTFPRTGKPGRPKKPAKAPQLDSVYGRVINAIAGKSDQVCQIGSAVQDLQPSLSLRLHSLEATHPLAIEQGFSILVTKGVEHVGRIAGCYV